MAEDAEDAQNQDHVNHPNQDCRSGPEGQHVH